LRRSPIFPKYPQISEEHVDSHPPNEIEIIPGKSPGFQKLSDLPLRPQMCPEWLEAFARKKGSKPSPNGFQLAKMRFKST
jgi:hypothetical protein